ncbi:DUF2250 domain-containing protein [candidate division GN15 bacterium]|nr:DUF2250 domain-containing protein [candidate division GN15 bacterium]
MADKLQLREKYTLAKCCHPTTEDEITGYFSFDDHIKVHRTDCQNLSKAEPSRLIDLTWSDIMARDGKKPGADYSELEAADFAILKHHRDYDVDYSLKVARMLKLDKQEVFDRHKKLRAAGLLERVDAVMIQYRKGVVDNKWIKHRNHTYYGLTDKGRLYLEHWLAGES